MKWTLQEALPVIKKITEEMNRHGYMVALYGSVLTKGEGRDLDLQFIPKRHKHEITASCVWIFARLTALFDADFSKQNNKIYSGLLGTKSNTILLPDGRIIDIVIQPSIDEDAAGKIS